MKSGVKKQIFEKSSDYSSKIKLVCNLIVLCVVFVTIITRKMYLNKTEMVDLGFLLLFISAFSFYSNDGVTFYPSRLSKVVQKIKFFIPILLYVLLGVLFFLNQSESLFLKILYMIYGIFFALELMKKVEMKSRQEQLYVKDKEKNIVIYGAGEAGMMLAKEFLNNPKSPYKIVGFLDDDKSKIGKSIYGIEILGDRKEIKSLEKTNKIDKIFIAIPSVSKSEINKIINEIKFYTKDRITIKIVPGLLELLKGSLISTQLRDVRIEDLLGRDEIRINYENIKKIIEDKIVLVTGGAGSIGSELVRQIARFNPARLIALDINENDLYFLQLELKRRYPNLDLICEMCNIRERTKLEFLLQKYQPKVIFHAAAHKHVPMMENNPEEAIKNNIFGTKNVVELAVKYRVDRFVLISTDKAVNPTNIMGATKRACELIVKKNSSKGLTKFMIVRFGNVLGSNGSVIPIFNTLLKEGRNLTVTHKEITRYFMTISEAVQLVLEAGAIGKGGELFVLDMGEPVKIYELAKTMIKLSNANVGIDIVGLRPGEKLYEELLYDVKKATKTSNKKIYISKSESADDETDVEYHLELLKEAVKVPEKERLKNIMKSFIKTYKEVKNEKDNTIISA